MFALALENMKNEVKAVVAAELPSVLHTLAQYSGPYATWIAHYQS